MSTIYFYHTPKGWVWEQDGYKSPAYPRYKDVLTDYHDYKPLPPILGNSKEFTDELVNTVSDLEAVVKETFPLNTVVSNP